MATNIVCYGKEIIDFWELVLWGGVKNLENEVIEKLILSKNFTKNVVLNWYSSRAVLL